MNNYYVQILSFDEPDPIEERGPFSEHRAEKVDAGITINLNHEQYYTTIVRKGEEEEDANIS